MIALVRVPALVLAAIFIWMVAASQVPNPVKLPLGAVVEGAVVSQKFGCTAVELEPFDPFCPGHHIHTGIDLAAPAGTPVSSATAGTARTGFDPGGAGMYVEVIVDSHVRILYCHLSAFRVRSGASLTPGDVIGLVGSTGRATGPHVHLEVQVDGRSVDPAAWLAS
ncbi:MAG TPA: M23 family metallopeptidase [Candidatus Baltobacterales bacterium]|nr:M23 family metallopeptidase [Candidatus Baltobacterales bacterium]